MQVSLTVEVKSKESFKVGYRLTQVIKSLVSSSAVKVLRSKAS